jgi:hypothetical protein
VTADGRTWDQLGADERKRIRKKLNKKNKKKAAKQKALDAAAGKEKLVKIQKGDYSVAA